MEEIIDKDTEKLIARSIKERYEKSKVKMYEYKGVYFSEANVDKATLDNISDWKARTDDVYVMSYPKAGTTWTQEILYQALNGTNTAEHLNTFSRVPYLEGKIQLPKLDFIYHPLRSLRVIWCVMKIIVKLPKLIVYAIFKGELASSKSYRNLLSSLPSRRLIKSHLPHHLLPTSIFTNKSKVIYIARNPKDLAVSYYYFSRWQPMFRKYESWDEFISDFMDGKVSYGNWYEHYLGFWNRRNDDNVLFLKYEDMKKDQKSIVKKICEFLGYQYSDYVLDQITEKCNFTNMKKNPLCNPDSLDMHREGEQHVSFMRKGIVGDWKNHFSDEQNKRFDAIYKEKLAGTGLDFDFESSR